MLRNGLTGMSAMSENARQSTRWRVNARGALLFFLYGVAWLRFQCDSRNRLKPRAN
jgi:hypothetical protein